MKFLKQHRMSRALEANDAKGLLPLLKDPSDPLFPEAWAALRRMVAKRPEWMDDPEVFGGVRRLREAGDEDLACEARELLFLSRNPALLPEALSILSGDPASEAVTPAIGLVERLLQDAPDALREACERRIGFTDAVRALLTAAENVKDPRGRCTVRLVELLGLWDDDEVRHEGFKLFCRSRFADGPAEMALILGHLDASQRVEIVEPLLLQFGVDPENQTLAQIVETGVVAAGEAAIEALMRIVSEYRHQLATLSQKKTLRSPIFYASEKALQLLGRVAPKGHPEVVLFLTDVAADLRLERAGLHRKRAREALEML